MWHSNLVSTGNQHLPDFTVAWQNVRSRSNVTQTESMWTNCLHWFKLRPICLMWSKCPHEVSRNAECSSGEWRFASFTTSTGHFDQLILGAPFSLHGFPAPFQRRFPALPLGVMAGYHMQTVLRLSRYGAGFGNKKSPHNNLNLTIPSGMALVRVCYVAIRKSKTCSGSFRSRAGTLSKYVILNCWNRLPQKSSRVNKKLWKHDTFGGLQENAKVTLVKRENWTARFTYLFFTNSAW